MADLYAKVIEDNGGGLHLYVMDSTGTCIYAHYGYGYRPGALTDDIKVLIETDSVADWEGCEENVYRQLYGARVRLYQNYAVKLAVSARNNS